MSGERGLRELELRLLGAGVTVARTDDDLVRYHGKMMLVDRRVLYLLAFNFTYLDMERSRSFGIVTTNKKHVLEAARLFEADTKRLAYTPGSATFIVSPLNARKQLTTFIRGAKKELLIYDPEIADPAILKSAPGQIESRRDGQYHRKGDCYHQHHAARAAAGSEDAPAYAFDHSRRELGICRKPESSYP